MKTRTGWNGRERRAEARVAGKGALEVAVLDQHGQVRKVMPGAEVINVSGGGVAFTASDSCDIGTLVQVRTKNQPVKPFRVQIVGTNRRGDGRSKLRGRLVSGSVPACLMYGW
ncbi:MAG: hypothetical protein Kow00105_14030 [Phycisphaeraceae bacterium]